jgi:hypothetical protein
MLPERTRHSEPYYVQQTPRGAVVVCAAHTVTEEIKLGEACSLAVALNKEFAKRMTE